MDLKLPTELIGSELKVHQYQKKHPKTKHTDIQLRCGNTSTSCKMIQKIWQILTTASKSYLAVETFHG